MSQPSPLKLSRDPGDGDAHLGAIPAASPWLVPGLALGALGALDIALTMRLAGAIGAVLAERDAPFVPVLAATGCAMTASAALALTWLQLEDLFGSERSIFS